MGEEDPIRKPNPENPKNRLEARGELTSPRNSSAGGESTVDGRESSAAAARAEERICIGPYVLIRKLGEGGMGQVWLAEQTVPVKRQVALKLIKGELYDSAVIQRFESERQSLAVMNHPAIAKVFDAGSTKDGQPYFVMEYVDGPPITRYCDNERVKIRERLELFINVCEGVQHAHQKAVIHRDLKPSNILVTEVDGKATPRIIDFGIAKAISSQPGAEQTQFTEMGVLVGTRGFMSPEQADPNVLDVDTRTDVYSLGVVLYVLLTGMLPFDSEGGKKKPIDEVLRQLREEDPPSPSTKISTEKETATAAAERRGTGTKQLAKLLRGDLDWITMKAVEKDRAQRYSTPSELAADVERYLENRPVVARPASKAYRLNKYVQRHRLGVTVAAGAAALLVAFAITEAVQLRRTTRERDRANRITDFMTGMFKVSDPSEARGNSITAREVLDKASKDIDIGLRSDPQLQAQMMFIMSTVYENLGLYSRSESLADRAADIRLHVLGPNHPDTLEAQNALAWEFFRERRYPQSAALLRQTLEKSRRALGPENPTTLATMERLGLALSVQHQYQEGESLERQALELQQQSAGPENPSTVQAMDDLAHVLIDEDRLPEAESLFRKTLDIHSRQLGPEHPQTLSSKHNLTLILSQEGHFAQAEKFGREELETKRRILGPEHPDTLATMHTLGITLANEGHSPEAQALYRQALEAYRRVRGPEDPDTLAVMQSLGTSLGNTGHLAEAEQLDREALAGSRRALGPEHPVTADLLNNLADTLSDEKHYDEAETLNQQALEIRRRIYGDDHPITASSVYNLACLAALKHQPERAFSLLTHAVDHGLSRNLDLQIAADSDLSSLRGDPRFIALVDHAKQRAGAAPNNPN
jgi:serine/threonine protein kinase